MKHERLAIPRATADEVPPGLTITALLRHLKVNYYGAKLWVFHTGYQVCSKYMHRGRGNAIPVPSVPLSEMPEGLCHYEVADKLGVPARLAKQWAVAVGYKLIDGRAKYCKNRSWP